MDYFQNIRYIKSNKEKYVILDIIKEKDKTLVMILGKTNNIYTITIKNNIINCNCPDGDGFCKDHDYICKHSCFLLFKILKMNVKEMNKYFNTYVFSNKEFKFIENKISIKSY